MKKFWYESNACWGTVEDYYDLEHMFEHQLNSNGGIRNVDNFLDMSCQRKDGVLNFGTYREHVGGKSLREYLKEEGLLEGFLKHLEDI